MVDSEDNTLKKLKQKIFLLKLTLTSILLTKTPRLFMLKTSNLIQTHLLVLFFNISNQPPINLITKLLVTVVEVKVIIIKNSIENLDINLVLFPAQTVAQNITIISPLILILHIVIVTDLAMIKIIETLPQEHIILLAQTILQHPLAVQIRFTLVFANAPLVETTPLLDAMNHQIVLLLSHEIIAVEVDLTLI